MTTAITIPNPLPAQLVALDERVTGLVAGLVDELNQYADLPMFNDEDAAAVQDLFLRARSLEKEIEANRTTLKRPILDLGKALDSAAKGATEPLAAARESVNKPLLLWQQRKDDERRRQEEERRRAIELARQAEREAAEAAARARAEAVEAADDPLAAMLGIGVAPVVVAPAAPVAVIPEKPEAVRKTVKVVRRAKLIIDDDGFVVRGVTGPDGKYYKLMVPDPAAIKAALEAGLQVNQGGIGARLEWEDQISATGR